MPLKVLIKGAGDLATGVAYRLHRAGMLIAMTEIPCPTAIRRAVAFAQAVYSGVHVVEGITARRVESLEEIFKAWERGEIPVIVDPETCIRESLKPHVLVDAIMAKRNTGTSINDAPIVIALGPGFTAGADCHAVIETNRGHYLGRVILKGQAQPNTGIPGEVGGETERRVLRAPADGTFRPLKEIGDFVEEGETVAEVNGVAIKARIKGVLRGILYPGLKVRQGMKVGDVDPRGVRDYCFTISDKSLSVAGGVLEAILYLKSLRSIPD
ncbi:MAG: selenium-dependent molybdenum cofactor biosynthesis protein YqeB [Anaerolineae bacterium]|nr:selenium-dependent molybdenum cofactor biosynthesis protein YqeB [Anaerolineae bacterium]MDW8101342.1 selenium-dependent molybdenum cofactor biosynthesis protein YqeB [Anaerolineae bacterium]